VEGALAHGGDGGRHAAVGREEHDRHGRPARPQPPEEREAVHPGHLPVGDDDVGRVLLERGEGRITARTLLALVADARERPGDDAGHALLVVHDHHARLHAAIAGMPGPESSTTSSTAPSRAWAASVTSPPNGTASAALARSPSSTWDRRSGSALTAGRPGDSARPSRAPLAASSPSARSAARSKRSRTETARGSRGSGRANSRSDETTLARRSISAVMKAHA